jgi:type VI secretion system protein ImpF
MEPQVGLLPSILDRLIDPESRGTVARAGYSMEQTAKSVQEDLQWLLNTRSDDSDDLHGYPRLARVLGYGLPDLATLSRLQDVDTDGICRTLEERILRYEPRLKEVRVSLKQSETGNPLKVELNLHAVLAVDPAPDLVFDTTLDLASGHFSQVT